jgi:YfiH family protein
MALDVITSDALRPCRHGFFARPGGASSGIFHGLNCGQGSSDQAQAVAINRSRVAAHFEVPVTQLHTVFQHHSADVHVVTSLNASKDQTRADAMVTNIKGPVLGVLTADCQPVLFSDPEAGVIGAAHAGWRGAMGGVLENTILEMEKLGADRRNITAIIGPSISQWNYEVGTDFFEEFMDHDAKNIRFFANGNAHDKYQFDLPAFGIKLLLDAGVGHAKWTRHCTYAVPDRFFSYRRSCHLNEADYGRLISAITL